MATELKPCPFCGSNDVQIGYQMPKFGEQVMHCVICNTCRSRTDNFRRKSTPVEIWNARVEDDCN